MCVLVCDKIGVCACKRLEICEHLDRVFELYSKTPKTRSPSACVRMRVVGEMCTCMCACMCEYM